LNQSKIEGGTAFTTPTAEDASSVVSLDSAQASPSANEKGFAIATTYVSDRPDVVLPGNGDLWPSCWSDDGELYAAWGDGWGFDSKQVSTDIGVARLSGSPRDNTLTGTNVAVGDALGQSWAPPGYNRKPTGMACVDGDLYLSVQTLAPDFDDAPAATIARSRDKGRTWEWDREAPMFADHLATTIFFLDYGQDGSSLARGPYVYAYALDGNWRDAFANRVTDPTSLWLARIPRDALQQRARWEWLSGLDARDTPSWSTSVEDRIPVLADERRLYQKTTPDLGNNVSNLSVLSQGSVVYNAPLDRYIYTSWTEYTFEFYEAPQPWGPFRLFFSKDFGGYPWSTEKSGGYATTIPSKFISDDGRSMYVQSNTFWGGTENYSFNLREFSLAPWTSARPENAPGEPIPKGRGFAVVLGSSFRLGHPELVSDDQITGQSEDSRTGEAKEVDYWGYSWPRSYAMNRLLYTTGQASVCGGFLAPIVEVRREGTWYGVQDLESSPPYPVNGAIVPHQTYVFSFSTASGDGVRLRGKPSGSSACTSISELTVQYVE
jgi:hypothetical protein